MPHRRSKQAYVQRIRAWNEQKTDWQIANDIILEFCYQDRIDRDKVWIKNKDFEEVVELQLTATFEGDVPVNAVYRFDTLEYGEVLNRFPLKPFPLHNYVDRGALQK